MKTPTCRTSLESMGEKPPPITLTLTYDIWPWPLWPLTLTLVTLTFESRFKIEVLYFWPWPLLPWLSRHLPWTTKLKTWIYIFLTLWPRLWPMTLVSRLVWDMMVFNGELKVLGSKGLACRVQTDRQTWMLRKILLFLPLRDGNRFV